MIPSVWEFINLRNSLARKIEPILISEIPPRARRQSYLIHICCLATADSAIKAMIYHSNLGKVGIILWAIACLPPRVTELEAIAGCVSSIYYEKWSDYVAPEHPDYEKIISQAKKLLKASKEAIRELGLNLKEETMKLGASIITAKLHSLKGIIKRRGLNRMIALAWLRATFSQDMLSYYAGLIRPPTYIV